MTDSRQRRFSPEVPERAVRLVQQHQGDHPSEWAAITSIAAKIGCTGETLRGWLRQAERNSGQRAGTTRDDRGPGFIVSIRRVPPTASQLNLSCFRTGVLVSAVKDGGIDGDHHWG